MFLAGHCSLCARRGFPVNLEQHFVHSHSDILLQCLVFLYFVVDHWCIDVHTADNNDYFITIIVLSNSVQSGMTTLIHIHSLVSTLQVSLPHHQKFWLLIFNFISFDGCSS